MTTQTQASEVEPVDSVEDLPEDLQPALADFLISLADNKQFLGMRYAAWCDGAPTLEAGVAAAGMAQDELGHARSFHTVLRSFPQVPAAVYEKETERDDYRQIAFLREPLERWTDLIVANFLFDTALTVLFEAATDSRFTPFQQRSRKIVEEERFHHMYSQGWFQRLGRAASNSRKALQAAVDRLWIETLCWYGPAEGDLRRFKEFGLFDGDGNDLRQRLVRRVLPAFRDVGIKPPIDYERESGTWMPTSALPWDTWDSLNRRLG